MSEDPQRRPFPRSFSTGSFDVSSINGVEQINESDDLPNPSNGTHTLEDGTAYHFADIVTSPYSLELGTTTPLVGVHGGVSGFIHTGGSAAITGTNSGYFARDMYIHAPGGTIYDLTGDQTTEMLVESVSHSDAAGIANIADLGTIDGFRVPTFKGCNFEEFDSGLTFTGSSNKIFISGCPLREVTASGVTILTFDANDNTEIVDIADSFVRNVQADTQVVNVEAGGEPSEVFQYRGTTHGSTVDKSNIITGPNASIDLEPFWVSDSHPLRDSGVAGEMHNDVEGSIALSTTDTYSDVDLSSTLDTKNRIEKQSDGYMKYVGTSDIIAEVSANVSFYGANGDIYTWGISLNGNPPKTQHTGSVEARGTQANVIVPVNSSFTLSNGDVVNLEVKNESNNNDPTIRTYTFNLSE